MSRETEKLYEAITDLPDDIVTAERQATAGRRAFPRRRHWMAAGLCLVVGGVLSAAMLGRLGGMGASAGGTGADGAVFMSYAGPVFPLTALSGSAVTAERDITYDFSPYQSVTQTIQLEDGTEETYEERSSAAIVTDGYRLSNPTEENATLTAVYPFAGSLHQLARVLPTVTVDGAAVDATLHAGPYTGGFSDAVGGSDPEGTLNLEELHSWDGYKALLGSGGYQAQALGDDPALDTPVTVYEFGEFTSPGRSEKAQAPHLAVQLSPTDAQARILTYGFNSYSLEEDGTRSYGTFLPAGEARETGRVLLVIVDGDIGGYALQGYRNGAMEDGNELPGVSAAAVRYETTLAALLRQLSEEWVAQRWQWEEADDTLDAAMVYRCTAELLLSHGTLSDAAADRYCGMLEEVLSDAFGQGRVFYLTFPVTVPAGGSASVAVELYKNGSHDFACQETEHRGLEGYDLVTTLGSALRFTGQTAAVETHGLVEITGQNFGFDVANGVTVVKLDMAQEHYWMEVRRKEG